MKHSLGVQALAIWVVAGGCQFDTSPLVRSDVCLPPNARLCPTAAQPQQATGAATGFGNAAPIQTSSPPMLATMATVDAAPPSHPVLHDQPVAPPSEIMDLDAGMSDPTDAKPSAADAAEAGRDAGAQTQPPGMPFSTCSTSSQCMSPLVCTIDPTNGSGIPYSSLGYCTATCQPSAMGNACPQPSGGEVAASCSFNGLCALGSCERAKCPSTMSCVQTPILGGSGGVTYISHCEPVPNP
jgi:hypothetical protein